MLTEKSLLLATRVLRQSSEPSRRRLAARTCTPGIPVAGRGFLAHFAGRLPKHVQNGEELSDLRKDGVEVELTYVSVAGLFLHSSLTGSRSTCRQAMGYGSWAGWQGPQ